MSKIKTIISSQKCFRRLKNLLREFKTNPLYIIIILILLGLALYKVGIYSLITELFKIDNLYKLLTGAIVFWWGLVSKQKEHNKMEKELFDAFNKKYDEKFNDRLMKIKKDGLKDEDEALLADYLNMCSEEYLWYKKNLISFDVWEAWRSGIIVHINDIPSLKALWHKEMKDSKTQESYYGLYDELKDEINCLDNTQI